MKYLRRFNEDLVDDYTLQNRCYYYHIENYTIDRFGIINVDGDVNLKSRDLDKLPFKFGEVTGNFYCDHNLLTSLKGAPKKVGGSFICNDNLLTTIEDAPKEVGETFRCSHNLLTSLKGAPNKVNKYFLCDYNQLITLEYAPKYVGSNFYCEHNQLISLEGAPQYIGGDLEVYYNKLTSLKGLPKRINGILNCKRNKIKNIDHLPYCSNLIIDNNPISKILTIFDNDIELIFDFKDREIIQNDIIIMDRLMEFLEDNNISSHSRNTLYSFLQDDYQIR